MGLQKNFGPVNVINDLNLNVEPGEFLALLGPSGSGKSTLLNIVAGLDHPGAGRVLFDETDVRHLPPGKRKVAMVFQSHALYPTMSVRRNMGLALRASGMAAQDVAHKVLETARLLQIEHLLDRMPAQLAGGQAQRVAIGRALARDQPVLLLDEPLSHLDAQLRADLRCELKRLHGVRHGTTLYVTHDQTEAMTMATRIAVLHNGRVQQCDKPSVIYERPANTFVAAFVGSPKMSFVEGTFAINEGWHCITHAAGAHLPLPGLKSALAQQPGQPLIVGIRPEHVELVPEGTPGSTHGRITDLETTGPDVFVSVALAASHIVARTHSDKALLSGSPIAVRIAGEAVSLFHAGNGVRLS